MVETADESLILRRFVGFCGFSEPAARFRLAFIVDGFGVLGGLGARPKAARKCS